MVSLARAAACDGDYSNMGQAREPILRTEARQPTLDSRTAAELHPAPGRSIACLLAPQRLQLGLFKTMLWKHLYIARKRKRIWTMICPVFMYCTLMAGMSYGFKNVKDQSLKAMLFAIVVPMYLVFAIQGALQGVIIEIVTEKESMMKVLQEIYGLSVSMYWASWGAYFLLLSAVCIGIIYLGLAVASEVIVFASTPLLLLILFASYAQQFAFAAILSVLFDKQQTATSVAGLANLLLTLLGAALQAYLPTGSKALWYFVGLLPYSNIFNVLSALMWLEAGYSCTDGTCSRGLSLNTLWGSEICYVPKEPCQAGRQILPAGISVSLMLGDVLLYSFLAWWLEHIWQGEYGSAKSPFFCIDLAFLCPRRRDDIRTLHMRESDAAVGPECAMSIQKLRKVFKGNKVAVDDLTLDVYSPEIFALLGHNGAGKTTAINCVIGLIPPTSGEAHIHGFSIVRDLAAVRRQLSICPQDNPMYDVFTVRQHLQLFGSLRGVAEEQVDERIGEVMAALEMEEKIDELCSALSGGQKRRLWVATALIGKTPTVFLDEPTSGMDPLSRQKLWALWRSMKLAGHTVIFTTHYLDEADKLADRKAVLAKGKAVAVGTSRDLKAHFGIKYHLHVEMLAGAVQEHLAALRDLISHHVPSASEGAGMIGDGDELSTASNVCLRERPKQLAKFTLPVEEVKSFGPLLLQLESQKAVLNVKHYSLSMTSLEEVFMALGRDAERSANGDSSSAVAGTAGIAVADDRVAHSAPDAPLADPLEVPRAKVSAYRQIKAMTRVRLLAFARNRRAMYGSFLMPLLMDLVAFAYNPADSKAGVHVNYNLAVYPPASFGIAIVNFTVVLIKDRESKCNYVALSQGLSVRAYWFGTLAAHYLLSLPVALLIPLFTLICKPAGLHGHGLLLMTLEAFVYPVGTLLYAYSFAFCFSTAELSVKFLPMSNLFLGTVPTICVQVLLSMGGSAANIAKALHVAMSVVNPVYAFPGMMVFIMHQGSEETLGTTEEMNPLEYFVSWCAIPLWCSVFCTALFGSLLIWRDGTQRTSSHGALKEFGDEWKDDDVLVEETRVRETGMSATLAEEAASCQGLMYTYPDTRDCQSPCSCCSQICCCCVKKRCGTHAVRGISLSIRSGECFGLLGPNGAGKTTALALLTGELRPPSAGTIKVLGHDLRCADGLAAAYKNMGVCPQVDPLWQQVTGRQHLLFYGRVKGVPEASLPAAAAALLERLGIDSRDADKPTSEYSGGMKRKLSLGIALIGRSPLLFLDEPSAAVDAGAKRNLWKVIQARGADQTVVLTTHSMEEAEALCDRIAIQVRGQLRCLGSPLHIKSKYGSGYQLELLCNPVSTAVSPGDRSNSPAVLDFVRSHIADSAQLLEHDAARYLFQLPPMVGGSSAGLTLGKVFTELQDSAAEAAGIVEYSLMQPSLEQVFIRFAREQDTPEDDFAASSSAPGHVNLNIGAVEIDHRDSQADAPLLRANSFSHCAE